MRFAALFLIAATLSLGAASSARPLRMVWQLPSEPPALEKPSTLRLSVRWGVEGQDRQAWANVPVEILINLPPGVRWVDGPKELVPIEEEKPKKDDESGSWRRYVWKGRLSLDAVQRDEALGFDVGLKPVARGENWILTAALTAGDRSPAADNAVVFLTLTDTVAKFHNTPEFKNTRFFIKTNAKTN